MSASPELREQYKIELAELALRCGNRLRLKGNGSSMVPSLWPGDEITIEKAPAEALVPGDIVLRLWDRRRFVIHRLIAKLPGATVCRFVTRGDAVPQNDPPAVGHQVLGRVSKVRRGDRVFVPARELTRCAQLLAWLVCRSDAFRSLTLRVHSVLARVHRAKARLHHQGAHPPARANN